MDRVTILLPPVTPGLYRRSLPESDGLSAWEVLDLNAIVDIDHGILDTWLGPDLRSGHVLVRTTTSSTAVAKSSHRTRSAS